MLSLVFLVVCAGCATGSSSKTELADVKAELRAIRDENSRLERRMTRLESLASLGAPSRGAGTGTSSVSSSALPKALPDLTVVKLKPRREPAPKLDTRKPVVEPDPEAVETLFTDADIPSEHGPESSPAMLEKQFEDGVLALKTGNVEGGVATLRTFALENPKHSKSDNALYFVGLGLIGLSNPEEAASAFELLVSRYPASDSALDALLRLAECRVRLKQQDAARALYTRVIASYPGTAAATQAEQRLAALQTP
jgi:tol-pal system protein YbgF